MGLAAAALQNWRLDSGGRRPGASVSVLLDPSPTVALQPSGLLFMRSSLEPTGRGPATSFSARNATGAALHVRVRAKSDVHDLDPLLHVRVRVGARTLFDGPLEGLHGRGSAGFVLSSHATTTMSVAAWLPRQAGAGYVARAETVHVELETRKPAA